VVGSIVDFFFTEEEREFRQEVWEFFQKELPSYWMIRQLHADEEVESEEE